VSDADSIIDVAAGVIVRDGRYLIAQRFDTSPHGGLWEFPGGKRQPGEALEDCLRRELIEELGVVVDVGEELKVSLHAYRDYTVRLHFFRCTIREGTPRPLASQACRWVSLSELKGYAFPEANRKFVEDLRDHP
jgi:mutator protein MutT